MRCDWAREVRSVEMPCYLSNSDKTSSLVDEITYKLATQTGGNVTSSAILGPFWRADTPIRENGSTITFDTPADGQVVYLHGMASCGKTGAALAGATVEVWQASTNGKTADAISLVL